MRGRKLNQKNILSERLKDEIIKEKEERNLKPSEMIYHELYKAEEMLYEMKFDLKFLDFDKEFHEKIIYVSELIRKVIYLLRNQKKLKKRGRKKENEIQRKNIDDRQNSVA